MNLNIIDQLCKMKLDELYGWIALQTYSEKELEALTKVNLNLA